jgi:hypothetical protein
MADAEQLRQEAAPRSSEVPASELGSLGPEALVNALRETATGERTVFASETRLLANRVAENGGAPADAAELDAVDEEAKAAFYDFNQEVEGIMRGQDAQTEVQESWRASDPEVKAAEPENLRAPTPSMMARALENKPRPEVAQAEAAAQRVETWQALTKAEAALQAQYDQQMQQLILEASTARASGSDNDRALNETLRQLNEIRARKQALMEIARVSGAATPSPERPAQGAAVPASGEKAPANQPAMSISETIMWGTPRKVESLDEGEVPHPSEAALPEDERRTVESMDTIPSQPSPKAPADIYEWRVPRAPAVPRDIAASLRADGETTPESIFPADTPEWPADDENRIAELEAKIKTREEMGLEGISMQLDEMREELARLKTKAPAESVTPMSSRDFLTSEPPAESVMPLDNEEVWYPEDEAAMDIGTADTVPPPKPQADASPRPPAPPAETPSDAEQEDEPSDLPGELMDKLGDWLSEDEVSDWKPLAELEKAGDATALAERLQRKNLERELAYLRRGLDLHQAALTHMKDSEKDNFRDIQLDPLARRAHDISERLAKAE